MRTVVQRVAKACVTVGGREVARIGTGLCCLVGVEAGDTPSDIDYTAAKICSLRIFDDQQGRMNLAVAEVQGEVLVVPQFTLLGDARQGRRPSYSRAEPPDQARALIEKLVEKLSAIHAGRVATGVFQAEMEVEIHNQGPVTILLDSRKLF
ncbi:MAG TPA: D-aminoacyl-tRNA deacylase [Deltaproteobacteria bacterium]|nr:D-aminoacyl-tRNA deacylase [Deltaproteobacteria bacterium]